MYKIALNSIFVTIFGVLIIGCQTTEDEDETSEIESELDENEMSETTDSLTYLALGDSYTIGESVPVEKRWPVQLVTKATADGYAVKDPKIIATTGWTTGELQQGIVRENMGDTTFNFVSLLIGVNNQYRGNDISIYQNEFRELLVQSIDFADGDTSHVFVVSIPDWGVTPFAEGRDQDKIANEIDAYNDYAREICEKFNVKYFYITDISREAETDSTLVAADKLHPSGLMYQKWVERIYPWFKEKLK